MSSLGPEIEGIVYGYIEPDIDEMVGAKIDIPPQLLREYTTATPLNPRDYGNIIELPHGRNMIVADIFRHGISDDLLTDIAAYKYIPGYTRDVVVKTLLPQYAVDMIDELVYTEASHQRFPNVDILKRIGKYALRHELDIDYNQLFNFTVVRGLTTLQHKILHSPSFHPDLNNIDVLVSYNQLDVAATLVQPLLERAQFGQTGRSKKASYLARARLLRQAFKESGKLVEFIINQPQFNLRDIDKVIDEIPIRDNTESLFALLFKNHRIRRALDPNDIVRLIDRVEDSSLTSDWRTGLIKLLTLDPNEQ